VNKYDRAEIKKLILTQLERLSPPCGPWEQLKMARLETALMRIDCEKFGACFKCEKSISLERLRINPEAVICSACLEAE